MGGGGGAGHSYGAGGDAALGEAGARLKDLVYAIGLGEAPIGRAVEAFVEAGGNMRRLLPQAAVPGYITATSPGRWMEHCRTASAAGDAAPGSAQPPTLGGAGGRMPQQAPGMSATPAVPELGWQPTSPV